MGERRKRPNRNHQQNNYHCQQSTEKEKRRGKQRKEKVEKGQIRRFHDKIGEQIEVEEGGCKEENIEISSQCSDIERKGAESRNKHNQINVNMECRAM